MASFYLEYVIAKWCSTQSKAKSMPERIITKVLIEETMETHMKHMKTKLRFPVSPVAG